MSHPADGVGVTESDMVAEGEMDMVALFETGVCDAGFEGDCEKEGEPDDVCDTDTVPEAHAGAVAVRERAAEPERDAQGEDVGERVEAIVRVPVAALVGLRVGRGEADAVAESDALPDALAHADADAQADALGLPVAEVESRAEKDCDGEPENETEADAEPLGAALALSAAEAETEPLAVWASTDDETVGTD